MRSFVAIPVTEDACDALSRLQTRLACGRPVPAENMHITLAFLDEQNDETLDILNDGLSLIRCAPFSVSMRGVGQFGSTLHVIVKDNAYLSLLHTKISKATRRAGIIQTRQRFRPHVTISRGVERVRLPQDIAAIEYPDMPVRGFALCASTLRPQGARYERLAQYPLQPETPNIW